jgi:hypothetical protein
MDPSRRAQHLRPPDLIYGLGERPPLAHLILLGAQHVAVICPYLVFITLIAQTAGATTTAGGLKLPLLLRSGVSGFTST